MIWWLNAHRLAGVQLTVDLEAVWAGLPKELGQRAWLIYLENEFDVPVMAGVVENLTDELLTIGFAARPNATDASHKAWAEALALQEMARSMQDPEGPFWNNSGNVTWIESLKAPRRDRRYLDEYRKDFHDVYTLQCQLQINLDPRARDIIRGWVDVDQVRPLNTLPTLPDRTAARYRERLEQRGFEVFALDMTTADVAVTNMRVARVVVPGLVPNYPAAFPPFGGRRVRQAAVSLGWRERQLEEGELNIFPLPHA
jgi:ribosomal protein S12 methylthiotransferase accessory factor